MEEKKASKGGFDTLRLNFAAKAVILIAIVAVSVFIGYYIGKPKPYNPYLGKRMSPVEVAEMQERLGNQLNYLMTSSNYINISYGGDSYDVVLHNSKCEAIKQDSGSTYFEFYLTNGNVFHADITNEVSIGENVDIYKLWKSLVDNASEYKCYTLDVDEAFERESTEAVETESYSGGDAELLESSTEVKTYIYEIHVEGWDAVKSVYMHVSEKLADDMVEGLKAQGMSDKPHFIYQFMVTDLGDLSASCYYILDDTKYMNWYVDGYMPICEWEMLDEWYSYDFNNDENGDMLADLINKQIQDTSLKLNEFLGGTLIEDESMESQESEGVEGESQESESYESEGVESESLESESQEGETEHIVEEHSEIGGTEIDG